MAFIHFTITLIFEIATVDKSTQSMSEPDISESESTENDSIDCGI